MESNPVKRVEVFIQRFECFIRSYALETLNCFAWNVFGAFRFPIVSPRAVTEEVSVQRSTELVA